MGSLNSSHSAAPTPRRLQRAASGEDRLGSAGLQGSLVPSGPALSMVSLLC